MAMTRSRDRLIDKKIGSLIRIQRVKLGSKSELGNALGVTFTNAKIREWQKRDRIDPYPGNMHDTRNLTE